MIGARMRISAVLFLGTTLLTACSVLSLPSAENGVRTSQVRYVMGTLLELTVLSDSEEEGQSAVNDAFAIAEHLDSVLSTWKPNSPVSEFNRDSSLEPQGVDSDLYELVRQSQELSTMTDGAFSIGVRPLVELWEMAAKRNTLPSVDERDNARRYAFADALVVIPPNRLAKRSSGVMIETGGIGKGYAVDKMVALLKGRGIERAFINFGRSSIAALGAPPGERGWKVDLALSESSRDGIVTLCDETLSVSRAHGNPFRVAGKSYAHIFDPVSGMPVSVIRGAAVRGASATKGEAFVKYLVIRGAPPSDAAQSWSDVAWIVKTEADVERSANWDR